ncbi:MAG: glycosyltransferase family 39 protein [Candidatus Bathyarchaeia archaeon]
MRCLPLEREKSFALMAFLTLLGLLLRLAFLDHRSLYSDETWSFSAASMGPLGLLSPVASYDLHPPLYYMVLSAFLALGKSEFAIRFPSAIFGTLTIPLAHWLGRRFLGERGGLLVSFLLAISPMHVRYSQEARMYSLMALFATLSLILLLRAMDRGGAASWSLYGISAALCLYTHYIAFFFLLSESVLVLWISLRRGSFGILKDFMLSGICALAIFSPWIHYALILQVHNTLLAKRSLLMDLIRMPLHFSYFFPITRIEDFVSLVPMTITLVMYVSSLGLCGLLALFGLLRAKEDWLKIVVCWIFIPPIAALLVLYAIIRVWPWRSVYYLFELPIFLGLVASGLMELGSKRKALASILLVFLTASYGFANVINYQTEAEDWRAAAAFVEANAIPGDAIAFDRPFTDGPFNYYAKGAVPHRLKFDRVSAEYGGYDRVWLVVAHYGDPEESGLKRFLDGHCERSGVWRFAGLNTDIWVYLYIPGSRAR